METSVPSRRLIVMAAMVVFACTVVLRVPSCYESFWVDELHSAWCIWGSLGDVFPRADLGHQSPFYFVGLWCWKQIFGDSELALRMSSVLAVAASSVVLTIGVARWTQSLAAGATAGFVIALESNSLFFGTELRPYAFVMLFSSVAVVCFLRLSAISSRSEDRSAWIGIMVAILLAMLCQPTAIGVLAWLPLALLLVWLVRDRRQLLKFSLSDGFLLLSAAAVGFALWRVTLGESWQQRTNWASFATATRVAEIWQVWDWTWLLVVPLSVTLVAVSVAKIQRANVSISAVIFATLLLALISVLATSLYWLIARADWVPVWHRRYFIAVLPLFACVAGGAIGALEITLRPYGNVRFAGVVTAMALVVALPYQQGTLVRLTDYPVALVTRGEDWRAAIGWVRSNAEPKDLVFLDAGLVEANAWLPPGVMGSSLFLSEQRREYLVFAASGPYDPKTDVVPIDAGFLTPKWRVVADVESRTRRVFVISRQAANRVKVSVPQGSRVLGFGNVSVVFQSSEIDQSD